MLRVNCWKTIHFTAANTYMAFIWQYPPPGKLTNSGIEGENVPFYRWSKLSTENIEIHSETHFENKNMEFRCPWRNKRNTGYYPSQTSVDKHPSPARPTDRRPQSAVQKLRSRDNTPVALRSAKHRSCNAILVFPTDWLSHVSPFFVEVQRKERCPL